MDKIDEQFVAHDGLGRAVEGMRLKDRSHVDGESRAGVEDCSDHHG